MLLRSYQGYGIGPRLSDAVAQKHLDQGKRYNSRTAHPRLGAYRDASAKWRPHLNVPAGLGTEVQGGRKSRFRMFSA